MKLRKILAGFLAGAVAMSSMMFTSVAASMDFPDGKTEIVEGSLLSEPATLAQWGSTWVQIYNLDASKHFTEDYAIKAVLTTDTVLGWGDNGDPITTFIGWGWSSYSGWINVVKAYDGTAVAGNTGTTYAPSLKSTDQEYVVYIPTTDFTPDSYIAFNLQNLMSVSATVKSVELVSFGSATAPELPEYAYEFDEAAGSGAAWSQPAYTEVNDSAAVTTDTLAGDFIIAVPYTSDSKPNIVFSDGLGDSSPLNWIQIAPNCVVDGIAYYLKSDITAAWTAAGGSADFSEVVKILVAATASALEVKAPGAVLYSSVAPAADTYSITYDFSGCIGNFVGTDGSELSTSEIEAGTEVTIVLSDFSTGYELDTITATGESGTAVALTENADGTFTFTMPAENVDISATLKEVLPTAITLKADKTNILVGGKASITATFTPAEIANEELTWTSSDEAVATVMYGQVTGVAEGTAVITATSVAAPTVSAEITITVTTAEIPATSVTITTPEITLLDSVTAEIEYEYAPADTTDELVWTSSNEDVAIVSQTGVITPISAGTAIITLTVGEFSDTCTVTVISEGYDKTEASFTADTIVAQTSKSINNDGDVVTARRFVKMVSKASIEDKNLVTFTLSNGTATKTVEATSYYTELSASGETVVAPEGYVFLAYTVTDIPEGVTVTCTDITVSKK
ncbi:MAG: Ig-like domain-containing protein [Ruminiclostridium sp.]|nr:Ig-like domain-containing protein [Ruminiclostridium sp.]